MVSSRDAADDKKEYHGGIHLNETRRRIYQKRLKNQPYIAVPALGHTLNAIKLRAARARLTIL
jgi:hypothetical protein